MGFSVKQKQAPRPNLDSRHVHQTGDEVAWWRERKINPLEIARGLWEQSRANVGPERKK